MSFLDVEPAQVNGSAALHVVASQVSIPIPPRVAETMNGRKNRYRLGFEQMN